MTTKTVTINSLITDYAQDIAAEAGLDAADYPKTAAGLSKLLTDVAHGISRIDNIHSWLTDAAADLDALHRVDATSDQRNAVLARVDARLYEAHYDLT
ncbi:hypothetical protein DMH12_24785 [Streptomyces sp. WAC 04229]|uniref:hypothetical protein n=1 Tax=Streptomyces sp. WAC 04229 TaxID=2203206 RepID=UPI000F742DBE|nr:hypothetical protein [Streptomyces sp. WAC 04229]RSN50503.1 hypothetical protein DMH12_24785 [Streptomyces sp. WAC 04229]